MVEKIPYKSPIFKESSFNCSFCNAYARQTWHGLGHFDRGHISLEDASVCFCSHCGKYSIWHEEKIIYPNFSGIEPFNGDLNEEVSDDYMEAAEIVQRSPRGAAALLRLAIQKLCIQLGEQGKDLNTDIGNLVKEGLPVRVQESLDSLRVIGNEAVHPGELDLRDDRETATSLFKLVNFIAEKMITEPKEIEAIYAKLPETKKEQINNRDSVEDEQN